MFSVSFLYSLYICVDHFCFRITLYFSFYSRFVLYFFVYVYCFVLKLFRCKWKCVLLFICICNIYIFVECLWLVLKRCISGLPSTECPFIPKRILEQARSRRIRSANYNETNSSHDLVKRSPIQFPDSLTPYNQKAVDEPIFECEERRQVGTNILKEKRDNANSMLSRFVGNIIVIFSNQTTAQEVSRRGSAQSIVNCNCLQNLVGGSILAKYMALIVSVILTLIRIHEIIP